MRGSKGLKISEKGKFVWDTNDVNFDNAYRDAYDLPSGDTVPQSTKGFLNTKKSEIHLRPDALFGTALHESVHRLASPRLYGEFLPIAKKISSTLTEVLSEGVTAFFTDEILKEEGLPNFNDAYRSLKDKAKNLIDALKPNGFDMIGNFNFKGSGIVEIGEKLGFTRKQDRRRERRRQQRGAEENGEGAVSSRISTRVRAENAPTPSFTRMPQGMLQRRCACGGTVVTGGECAECRKKRLQRKLAVNQPGDRFEQEADRMADFVVHGDRQRPAFSNYSLGALQREEPKAPPKPDNYDEAISKILDALKATPVAKELQAKAAEMGKDFAASVEGKVIIGSSLGGALAAIIATNSKLPMQIPELPLDFIAPGLKAKITWEGPVQQPTNAGLVLTTKSGVSFGASYTKTPASGSKPEEQKAGLSLTIPLGGSSEKKKGGPTASEKYRAETARDRRGAGAVSRRNENAREEKRRQGFRRFLRPFQG